ncbi:MAG: DUF1361 domain-containing protein [Chitinophagaceae bacterium]
MKNLVKQLAFNRWIFLRSETDRLLTASMAFSVLMVAARIAYTGNMLFGFLIWNLVLAYIPYVLTNWLQQRPAWIVNKLRFAVVFIVWLLFIPNSFYILTDLFHLGNFYSVPFWFDLAMILSFAWNGLIIGILSVRQMEKMIQVHVSAKYELLFIYPIMWLNALGIYIGRYLRFNSWDVLTNPFHLVTDIIEILCHPVQYKYAWGMILCFSVFLTLAYCTIKKISKSIYL